MNVPMERREGNETSVFDMLAQAGYPIQSPLPYAVREAVSTGGAIAGIAGTAMGQLYALMSGQPLQMVFTRLR